MNRIIKILMSRDKLNRDEATEVVTAFKKQFDAMVDRGASLCEVEDAFMAEFDLEPDYLEAFLYE